MKKMQNIFRFEKQTLMSVTVKCISQMQDENGREVNRMLTFDFGF